MVHLQRQRNGRAALLLHVFFQLFLGPASALLQSNLLQSVTRIKYPISLRRTQRKTHHLSASQEEEGSIVRKSDFLNTAFTSLKEEEKYDAVITGICAKILDDEDNKGEGLMADLMALV